MIFSPWTSKGNRQFSPIHTKTPPRSGLDAARWSKPDRAQTCKRFDFWFKEDGTPGADE
jgi:hypothetical protein